MRPQGRRGHRPTPQGRQPPARTPLALIEPLDTVIRRLDKEIEDAADRLSPAELAVRQSTPGIGKVLSLTILLEIDRIGGLLNRLASRMGKARAYSALAHKLGRAFYPMLHTRGVFDVHRFVRH